MRRASRELYLHIAAAVFRKASAPSFVPLKAVRLGRHAARGDEGAGARK